MSTKRQAQWLAKNTTPTADGRNLRGRQSNPDPNARVLVRPWLDEAVQILICGDSSGIVADALARIAFALGRAGERIETNVAGCDPGCVAGEFRAFMKVVVDDPGAGNVDALAKRLVVLLSKPEFPFTTRKEF